MGGPIWPLEFSYSTRRVIEVLKQQHVSFTPQAPYGNTILRIHAHTEAGIRLVITTDQTLCGDRLCQVTGPPVPGGGLPPSCTASFRLTDPEDLRLYLTWVKGLPCKASQ